ncbi:uncharacterized protein stbd1 [Corythoichthys intestinalis]|uniref:uncharacterized protein stbd1 n=1 Tax=Corythoichthys intestinalis TaxID=161448 RepID=UPI0025A6004F|nr:uncharacterized protein stbd1 [Corythoichthys intestinalis]
MNGTLLVTPSTNEPHLQPPATTRGAHALVVQSQLADWEAAGSLGQIREHDHVTSDLSSTMAFKGSNGVAVERRVDLASLFCMIGRHGPAVALAVFALVSVLAGFVIYRTVRGRRRRKKATEGETDRAEGKSSSKETDEAVTQAGLELQTCVASTDVCDVTKEDGEPTETLLKVRRRPAAAAEKSRSTCAPDVQMPVNKHATSQQMPQVELVPSSLKEGQVYTEEPILNLPNVEAEIRVDPATACQLYSTDDGIKEEAISEGTLKEPTPVCDQICHEEVSNAKNQGDKAVTSDEDNSDNKTTAQEDNAQSLSSDLVHLKQTCQIGDEEDLDNQNKTTAETTTGELNIEEYGISTDKSGNDDFEEVIQQDSAEPNKYYCDQLAHEEGKKHVITEEKEKVGDGKNNVASEATESNLDCLNNTAVDFYTELDNPQIQVEHQEAHSLNSNQEMDILPHESGLIESYNIVSSEDDDCSSLPPIDGNDISGISSEGVQTDSISNIATHDQQAQKVPNVDIDETPKSWDEKVTTTKEGEAPVIQVCETLMLSSYEAQPSVEEPENALKKASIVLVPNSPSDNEASIDEYNFEKTKTLEEPRFDMVHDMDGKEEASIEEQNEESADHFSFVVSAPVPVVTEDIANTPKLQISLPLFEESELRADNICGGGEESGISSMAVSPEVLDSENNFPVMDHVPQPDMKLEPQLLVEDATPFVLEEDIAVHEPHVAQLPNQPCIQINQPNKDIFVHQSEECIQTGMGRFTELAQVDEWKREMDMKVGKVTGAKEKLECAENKEEDGQKDEDNAKTEINIMEATMDHNEWITDSNPNFPWLNLSVASFGGENQTASQQIPLQESNHPDLEPQSDAEVKQTHAYDFEENTISKRVNVTFRVHYLTNSPLQMLAVTGNQQELGNWKDFTPLECDLDGYWAAVVSLPAENHVQWKFVVVEKGEVCRWEECGNRLLNTGCGEDLLVHKLWGYL